MHPAYREATSIEDVRVVVSRRDNLDVGPAHPAVTWVLPSIAAVFGTIHLNDAGEVAAFFPLPGNVVRGVLERDEAFAPGAGRALAALRLLGPHFDLSALFQPIDPSVPIWTNRDEAWVAMLLLIPTLCRTLCERSGSPTGTLLAAFPSDTRILWTAHDTPEMAALLHRLASHGRVTEEEFLSDEVARFDGNEWRAYAAGDA